jgi:hypothetical protein
VKPVNLNIGDNEGCPLQSNDSNIIRSLRTSREYIAS